MAKENVKKFYEEISKNKELQEKLVKAEKSYTGDKDDKQAAVEAFLLPIAKEAGYDFTAEELKEVERELAGEKGISEEELENVSGGKKAAGCCIIGGANGGAAIACAYYGIGATGTGGGVGFALCWHVGIGMEVAETN